MYHQKDLIEEGDYTISPNEMLRSGKITPQAYHVFMLLKMLHFDKDGEERNVSKRTLYKYIIPPRRDTKMDDYVAKCFDELCRLGYGYLRKEQLKEDKGKRKKNEHMTFYDITDKPSKIWKRKYKERKARRKKSASQIEAGRENLRKYNEERKKKLNRKNRRTAKNTQKITPDTDVTPVSGTTTNNMENIFDKNKSHNTEIANVSEGLLVVTSDSVNHEKKPLENKVTSVSVENSALVETLELSKTNSLELVKTSQDDAQEQKKLSLDTFYLLDSSVTTRNTFYEYLDNLPDTSFQYAAVFQRVLRLFFGKEYIMPISGKQTNYIDQLTGLVPTIKELELLLVSHYWNTCQKRGSGALVGNIERFTPAYFFGGIDIARANIKKNINRHRGRISSRYNKLDAETRRIENEILKKIYPLEDVMHGMNQIKQLKEKMDTCIDLGSLIQLHLPTLSSGNDLLKDLQILDEEAIKIKYCHKTLNNQ